MTRPGAPAGPGILTGKVALVTGAASGIGRATALLFAREGAAVALFDRDDAGGQSAARAIEAEQGRALFVHGDARRAVDETVTRLGGLQILFNNAGIIRRTTIVDTSEEDWDQVMAANVKGIFLLSRRAVPAMARAGGGVILNTASVWGLVGGA